MGVIRVGTAMDKATEVVAIVATAVAEVAPMIAIMAAAAVVVVGAGPGATMQVGAIEGEITTGVIAGEITTGAIAGVITSGAIEEAAMVETEEGMAVTDQVTIEMVEIETEDMGKCTRILYHVYCIKSIT